MPYLGDFLGHVLSEITIARMQADLEALRVADYNSSHPLLRAMPVPRFRLPDVELDLPVVVDQIDEPAEGESVRGGVTAVQVREALERVLPQQLQRHKMRITAETKKLLDAAVERDLPRLLLPSEVSVDVNRIAHGLTKGVARIIAGAGPLEREKQAQMRAFEGDLKDSLRAELLNVRPPPPRLRVMVTTREIREAGPTDIVCRLHLKIGEEHLEWTLAESEGEERPYLVPE